MRVGYWLLLLALRSDVFARFYLFRYLHRHWVLHRDMKPNNLFLTNKGVRRCLDHHCCLGTTGTRALAPCPCCKARSGVWPGSFLRSMYMRMIGLACSAF